ncbi:hypothetical protein [Actinospica robiniae]|uniref:hypothetical protein n=1 Tax=Actinospica robiniae TaxID=304901 RepID=UPI0012FCBD6F|nr:hypothetical protein [Actinospica robiniae]
MRRLRWPAPRTREQAEQVQAALAGTARELEALRTDPRIPAGVRDGAQILLARIGFLRSWWETRLGGSADREGGPGWSREDGEALAAELVEIAVLGARLLDEIEAELCAGRTRTAAPRIQDPVPVESQHEDELSPSRTRWLAMQLRGGWLGHSVALGCVALVLAGMYEFILHADSLAAPQLGALSPESPPVSSPHSRAAAPSRTAAGITNRASGSARTGAEPATTASVGIEALQVDLLGGSATRREVDAFVSIDTADTSAFTLTVTYWGTVGGRRVGQSSYTTTLTGARSYRLPFGIPADGYCGGVVTVTATAEGLSASENTAPGC